MSPRLFAWWEKQLKTRPMLSNSAFSVVITAVGDILAQKYEHSQENEKRMKQQRRLADDVAAALDSPASSRSDSKTLQQQHPAVVYRSSNYNVKRTLIYSSLACIITPVWLRLILYSDKVIVGKPSPMRAIKQGVMTWGAGVFIVPLNVAYLTTTFSVFVHGVSDPSEIRRRIQERLSRNYFTHMGASLCFWSLHWLQMFYFLPLHLRVTYGSIVNVCWHGIASWIQHRH